MSQVKQIIAVGCVGLFSVLGHASSANEMSDPTAPPSLVSYTSSTPSYTNDLKLQSIQKQGSRYTVVINGARKSVGDTIEAYTVRDINLNQVRLIHTSTQQPLVLTLFNTYTDSIQQPGSK